MKITYKMIIFLNALVLTACATLPPKNPENICDIFLEHRGWYTASKDMNIKWGTPIHVPMAIMYQESSFRHNAAPAMQYFWFIPIGRLSDAYGYAQAKTATWNDYRRETNSHWSDRGDFADSIDFMGWFIAKTHNINGVSKWDAYKQYLNYHEGWGGYRNKSYKKKAWLLKIAKRVDKRSKRYATQLKKCKKKLDSGWLKRLFFG